MWQPAHPASQSDATFGFAIPITPCWAIAYRQVFAFS
jgi:hypothetical protein